MNRQGNRMNASGAPYTGHSLEESLLRHAVNPSLGARQRLSLPLTVSNGFPPGGGLTPCCVQTKQSIFMRLPWMSRQQAGGLPGMSDIIRAHPELPLR